MTIRMRMTLWFVAIITLVLVVFSYSIWQLTLSTVVGEVQRNVGQQVAITATWIHAGPHGSLHLPSLNIFSATDTYLQIRDPQGKVLASSANLGHRSLPLVQEVLTAQRIKEVWLSGVPILLGGQAVYLNGRLRAYMLVGRSATTVYLALGRLRGILFPGVAVALVLAGIASWLLLWRALHPLERLASTAAAIAAAHDHTRRLELHRPHDEIQRLSRTINEMLASLDDAYRQVRETSELRRQFLADVSHELRTPLTVMLSSLDLIAKIGSSDPGFREATLDSMRLEVERMARMVTQLLILARSDESVSMSHEPLLLGDILSDARRLACTAGTTVRWNWIGLDEVNGAVVRGHSDYLTQLFLILLDNAVKYTPGEGTVTLSAAVHDDTVAVTVSDTGMGIAAHELPHIFERFYRAANARALSGMGLGLAIAQRVAEQHGGRITVESTLGRGSRFTVLLPLLNPPGRA